MVKAWRAEFAPRALAWPALINMRWIGWNRDEHRTRRLIKRAWAFGDQDPTAAAVASQAGPIQIQRFSDQAAVRVVFVLDAA